MVTREEVMAEFLGGAAPPQSPARAAIMAEFLTPPAKPSDDELLQKWVDAQEKPSLLKRSVERLKSAGTDAKNRFDFTLESPIENLNRYKKVNPNNSTISKTRQALGADIIPAVSEVGGDIAATAIKEGVPEVVKDGVGYAFEGLKQITPDFIENGISAASAGVSSAGGVIGSGLAKWRAASPDSYDAAKEMANIATAFTPAKVPTVGMKTGLKSAAKNEAYKIAQRKKGITEMFKPDDIVEAAQRGQGKVVESKGLLKSRSFVPSEQMSRMYTQIENLPDIDPNQSYLHNMNALEDAVDAKRKALDISLEGADDIPLSVVTKDLDDVIAELADSPMLVGDAETAANKMYAGFSRITAKHAGKGSISPKELLQARRDFDLWLKKNSENIFDNNTGARSLAVKAIRNKVNQRVGSAVPDAKVAKSLSEQSDLLTARDTILPRASREGKNRLSRAVTEIEADTGLGAPRTPLAAGANATSPIAMGLTGAAALASQGRRGGDRLLRSGRVNAWKGLDKLVNNAPEAAARLAALNIINQDEDEEYK